MTSQRYRATYKMADMRYYGKVMTTTRWRLYVILQLQQYSRRLNLLYFYHAVKLLVPIPTLFLNILIILQLLSHMLNAYSLKISDRRDAMSSFTLRPRTRGLPKVRCRS